MVGPDCGVLLEGISGGDVEGVRRHEDRLDGVAHGAGAAGILSVTPSNRVEKKKKVRKVHQTQRLPSTFYFRIIL